MTNITPFKITVPASKIARLQQKLALTDFPDELVDNEPWIYGTPLSDLKELAHYWEKTFDWRTVEASLNKFPQYIANVEVEGFNTYDVHFIHQPSSAENAVPLLFIHGWPGSFIEVTKMLPDLVKESNGNPSFHVVAPSLIDFGFSSPSRKKGFGIAQQAEALHKVMIALGYTEYVIQGGDLGYLVARFLAMKYGQHVKAYLLNNVAPAKPTAESHPELHAKIQDTPLSATELAGLERSEWFSKTGDGYFRQQATKPQTIGYLLTDSPVGLLGWLYEKLHDWTDDYKWTKDEILTWVSIYYFSRAGPAASSYIYYEMEHASPPSFVAAQAYSDVPLGILRFPKDLILLPKLWNQTLGPVVYEKEHERGGHFAAWERPDAIVADLRSMFGKDGAGYKAVEGMGRFK